jgi:hypothetical protein
VKIQIFAELSAVDRTFEVLMGRRDKASVEPVFAITAHGSDAPFLFLDRPQQLGLQAQRHVADFVEKKRVPPEACRKRPSRRALASVHAPFSRLPKADMTSTGVFGQLSSNRLQRSMPLISGISRSVTSKQRLLMAEPRRQRRSATQTRALLTTGRPRPYRTVPVRRRLGGLVRVWLLVARRKIY